MKNFLALFFVFTVFFLGAQNKNIEVYIVASEECPICIYMSKTLTEIQEKYQNKVEFNLVFPNQMSNYKTIHLFKEKYKLKGYESKLDKDQSFTKKLNATITPEAVVMDKKGKVYYKGRISDAYAAPGKIRHAANKNDLDDAIAAALKGNITPGPWPKAVGCYITFEK